MNIKVFVYRNLHKNCLSVRDCRTRRVIAHLDQITLENVTFRVSAAGRARVLKERRKNVHAGVQGVWIDDAADTTQCSRRVIYDPYRFESFVLADSLAPALTAPLALVSVSGAMIPG